MKFRYDIQALRGFAVLIVILYHAALGPFKGGYLGVDIFFVISGFLITTLLIKHLEQGDFSFKEFYYRRVRRLLPAAYTVLFLILIGAYFFLADSHLRAFKNQFVGAITFTANIALFEQSGYFESDAKLKPLLHMWSLAIEEQFYLLLPAALFFVPRKFWKAGAFLATILSFGLCIITMKYKPEAAFFLLPFRAWELGIGCIGALYASNGSLQNASRIFFFPALAIILLIPVFPISNIHPGYDALLICLATLIIILRQSVFLGTSVLLKPLYKIGDWSYTLYLVHWPLFSFAANAYMGGEVPVKTRILLTFLSFVLTVVIYYLIERPLHKHDFKKRRIIMLPLVLLSILLASGALWMYKSVEKTTDFKQIRRHNFGLDISCSHEGEYERLAFCQTAESPAYLLWGDSYAMHLAKGLIQNNDKGLMQATKSACAPILNYAFYNPPKKPESLAKECIQFNNSVLDDLKNSPGIETVILSSPFHSTTVGKYQGMLKMGQNYTPTIMNVDNAIIAMTKTVQEIRSLGKKVVIISPPPKNGYDIGECLERKNTGKIRAGLGKQCTVNLDFSNKYTANVTEFLARLLQESDVNVIYLSDYLCTGDQCIAEFEDGTFVYRDTGHLTVEASQKLFREFNILEDINNKAY